MNGFWTGLLLVIVGGAIHGSFTVPQKFVRGWAWEKSWLIYSIVGMVFLPWLIVAATVPHPVAVYAQVSGGTLGRVALFGAGWGIGSVLFGLGVARVGMALTFAIVVSLTAAIGALVPMAVLHPKELDPQRVVLLLLGLAIVIVGVALCAKAGALKEAALRANEPASDRAKPDGQFARGLTICLLSGMTSPMLNFSMAFGGPLANAAVEAGAREATALSTIQALAISSGFLINAGYCVYLLVRNRSWRSGGAAGSGRNLGATIAMGLLWMFGMFGFGLGFAQLGAERGPILGWPLFMSTVVLVANVWGLATGEWKGAGRRALLYLRAGNAAIIVAIVIIAYGQRPASRSARIETVARPEASSMARQPISSLTPRPDPTGSNRSWRMLKPARTYALKRPWSETDDCAQHVRSSGRDLPHHRSSSPCSPRLAGFSRSFLPMPCGSERFTDRPWNAGASNKEILACTSDSPIVLGKSCNWPVRRRNASIMNTLGPSIFF